MYSYSVRFEDTERERLEQALNLLKKEGCAKSKRDLLVKSVYYVLLNYNKDLCNFFGQSIFTLEKKLQEKGGAR